MAGNGDFSREVKFEIVEELGVIAAHSTGWKKELNLVSWNGGQPKYDIRDWDPAHKHMSRGVTLHEKEMRLIFDLLRKRSNGGRNRQHEAGGGAPSGDAFMEGASASTPAPAPPPSPPVDPNDDFGSMEISEDGEVL